MSSGPSAGQDPEGPRAVGRSRARRIGGIAAATVLSTAVLVAVGIAVARTVHTGVNTPASATASTAPSGAPGESAPGGSASGGSGSSTPGTGDTVAASRNYPLHTGIVSTTFWVGEIFDPTASDGSQVLSTYDSRWFDSYGGCDGVESNNVCSTEKRSAANGFFPTAMTPQQNPFYLDLPFDDVNDSTARRTRQSAVAWAADPAYAGFGTDSQRSLLKNRWVHLTANGQNCYGQIEDAGPGRYHDSNYVFGATDARPVNTKFNGAGLDVSPALNGCLRFSELNGQNDRVDWQFIEASAVPNGPWLTRVTTTGVR